MEIVFPVGRASGPEPNPTFPTTTSPSHSHLSLNNPILIRPTPRLRDLEARRLQQNSEIARTSLHARVDGHHNQIEPCLNLGSTYSRQDDVVDDEFRVAGRHCIADMLEDHQAVLVGPVVQDVLQEVHPGA
jgi:hypothetical protein